jgi:tricorn protease
MKQTLVAVLAGALLAAIAHAGDAAVKLPRFPSISPQGDQIVFSWRGDLWRVGSEGGHAERLTSHAAIETRSSWSPDGSGIAFVSDRDGYDNIFVMEADGSGIRQVTHTDQGFQLTGFTPTGRELLLSSRREGDVYRANRPFRVSVDGGPIRRVHDAFGTWPVLAPGSTPGAETLAFVRGESRWSRRHYRGPDNRDVWLHDSGTGEFRRLTEWSGNDARPRWRDGRTILFLSDRDDRTVDLYAMDADRGRGSIRRLTAFADVDVQEFDVSADGTTAVLHAWDTLYTLDLTTPGARPRALEITAPQDAADDYTVMDVSSEVSEAALSPDGQVMAFIAHGDVYVRNVDEDQPSRRVTDWPGREREPAWSPDGVWLYFASDERGNDDIYRAGVEVSRSELKDSLQAILHPEDEADADEAEAEPAGDDAVGENGDEENGDGEDADEGEDGDEAADEDETHPGDRWHDAMRFTIEAVVDAPENDRVPSLSPDGERMLFRRTRGDLMMLDLASGEVSLFHESWNPWIDWRWSPDGRHVAISDMDADFNSDILIKPADGSGEAVNVSMHPDNDFSPRFSADGRILAFLSDRQGNDNDVWMVYLDKALESYTDLELKAYFEEAAKAAGKREPLDPPAEDGEDADDEEADEADGDEPVEWSLEDAYLRLRQVTSYPGDESNLELSAGGDRYVFTASGGAGGDGGLFTQAWDEREATRLGAFAGVAHLTLDGTKAVIVRSGRAAIVTLDGGKEEGVPLRFRARVDLEAQMSQMFHESARELGMRFYHPTMKGLDWDGLTERYHELVTNGRTSDEFAYVTMRLFGELNGSHLGAYPPGEDNPKRQSNGSLAVDLEPAGEAFRVARVVPFGPADDGEEGLLAGDLITAIDFEPFAPDDTVEGRLKGRVGEEVVVSVLRAGPGSPDGVELDLLLTPIDAGATRTLRYNDWQRHNAALVDEWSGGRIGYLHIRGMSQPHLEEFERDLYAAGYGKDALLIDVRSNGGGWTADRVLASIMVRPHAYTVARGDASGAIDGYPRDRLFIQRWTKPVNMLCNEKSFSNAEIVSHAFKTLGRGNLVGQETYGGVISTGGFGLIDGTWVRLPFRGWYVVGGMDMENNGAMPDIVVPQTPEDESANAPHGYDRQLRVATEDLMSRLVGG